MNHSNRLLLAAGAALAALAVAAPSASAGIIDNGNNPYAGPLTGTIASSYFTPGSGPSFTAGGTVTGEMTDAGWPAHGTVDFDFDVGPGVTWRDIETDGPYEFEITEGDQIQGEFTITEPVTFTLVAAWTECEFLAPVVEGTITAGSSPELSFDAVEFLPQTMSGMCGIPGYSPSSRWGADMEFDQPLFFEPDGS